MPPKAKFTKEEIISCAVEITRKNGYEKVTAREIGNCLKSSARPIFTTFSSMDEVKQGVIRYAKSMYRSYVEDGLKEPLAFRGVGIAYITFSIKEPKLFQLLFMNEVEHNDSLQNVLKAVEDSYDMILKSIMIPYKLSEESAVKLYHHLWIYTHGIATMCATNVCRFDMQQISGMITEIFKSLLSAMKRGELE